jgi:hypothetical protein
MPKMMNELAWQAVRNAILVAITAASMGTAVADVADCGELRNFGDIGPWDYADPSSSVRDGENPMGRIKRVENVHFNPEMKMLNTKRFSIERLTGEIHYTLRVFPNHPEALVAISRLERMAGGKLPQRSATVFTPKISAYCFFDRAIRFRPEDKAVRYSYAIHLHQNRKYQEALEQYRLAESQYEDDRIFQYNIGLLYADIKNWEKAAEHAQRAYSSGVTFAALRQRLEKAGYKIDTRPTSGEKPVINGPLSDLNEKNENTEVTGR